jgi:hypothetical protein
MTIAQVAPPCESMSRKLPGGTERVVGTDHRDDEHS